MKKNDFILIIGWVFFVVCAVLYTVSGIKKQDFFAAIASILFFVGCLFFIAELIIKIRNK